MKKLLLFGLMTCAIAGLHAEPSATNQSLENTKVELPSKKRVAARLAGQAVVESCGDLLALLARNGPMSKDGALLLSATSGFFACGMLQLLYKKFKDSYVITKSLMNADQTVNAMSRYTKKSCAAFAALIVAGMPSFIGYKVAKKISGL